MSFILKGLLLGLIAEVTNSKIIMNKVIYNSDNSNANVSAIVWSINDHSFLNVSAETFVDLDKIVMSFVFAVCRNENDKNYENVLVRSTLNSCKVNEGNRGNFMIKMAMADFDSTADFKWTCPFYKKAFHFTNFEPSEQFLPLFLMAESIRYSLMVRFDGKLLGRKKIVNLFSLKVFGEIRH